MRRRSSGGGQAGVPGVPGGPCVVRSPVLGLVEHRLERAAPARAQRRDAQRPDELVAAVAGQVEQRVDLGHRHPLGLSGHLHDLVAGPHLALGQHPEVEAGPVASHQQRRDLRVVQPDTDPVAGDPRLGHLEDRVPDPVPVPDAHLVVRQAFHGEVLAELPEHEVVPAELALPVPVRVELVDQDGSLLATVPVEVALPVPVEPSAATPDAAPADERGAR